jgi:hypothetical protein
MLYKDLVNVSVDIKDKEIKPGKARPHKHY